MERIVCRLHADEVGAGLDERRVIGRRRPIRGFAVLRLVFVLHGIVCAVDLAVRRAAVRGVLRLQPSRGRGTGRKRHGHPLAGGGVRGLGPAHIDRGRFRAVEYGRQRCDSGILRVRGRNLVAFGGRYLFSDIVDSTVGFRLVRRQRRGRLLHDSRRGRFLRRASLLLVFRSVRILRLVGLDRDGLARVSRLDGVAGVRGGRFALRLAVDEPLVHQVARPAAYGQHVVHHRRGLPQRGLALLDGDGRVVVQRDIVAADIYCGRNTVRGAARRLDANRVSARVEPRYRRVCDISPVGAVGRIFHGAIHTRYRTVRRASVCRIGRAQILRRSRTGCQCHRYPASGGSIIGLRNADVDRRCPCAIENSRQADRRRRCCIRSVGRNFITVAIRRRFVRIVDSDLRCSIGAGQFRSVSLLNCHSLRTGDLFIVVTRCDLIVNSQRAFADISDHRTLS